MPERYEVGLICLEKKGSCFVGKIGPLTLRFLYQINGRVGQPEGTPVVRVTRREGERGSYFCEVTGMLKQSRRGHVEASGAKAKQALSGGVPSFLVPL